MSLRVAFLRHGHTAWNREHRIQGRTDIPLDDAARDGLAQLQLPAAWASAEIWASPLARAVQTATLVAEPPRISTDLIEMNWGDWEGAKGVDLVADPASGYKPIEAWGWSYTPPGGEPISAVGTRVLNWLDSLERDAIAVTHIGVMRAALAQAWQWEFAGAAPFTIKRNRLYILEKQGQHWHPHPEPLRLETRQQ